MSTSILESAPTSAHLFSTVPLGSSFRSLARLPCGTARSRKCFSNGPYRHTVRRIGTIQVVQVGCGPVVALVGILLDDRIILLHFAVGVDEGGASTLYPFHLSFPLLLSLYLLLPFVNLRYLPTTYGFRFLK